MKNSLAKLCEKKVTTERLKEIDWENSVSRASGEMIIGEQGVNQVYK